MRRFKLVMLAVTMVMALGAASMAQQQPLNITVSVTNGDVGSLIDIAINAGKVADVTVPSTGNALSILDMSNLGKVRVEISVEVCVDGRTVIRIISEGETVPEDEGCTRRPLGGFLLGDGMRVSIDMQAMTATISGGGLSTTVKIGIGVGAAALGTGLAIGLTGGDEDPETPGSTTTTTVPSGATTSTTTTTTSTTSTSPTTSTTSTTSTTTTTTTTTLSSGCTGMNGVWTGSFGKDFDSCGGFSDPASIRVTCSGIPASGTGGICTLVHIGPNVGWTFNMEVTPSGSSCTFSATNDPVSSGLQTTDLFGTVNGVMNATQWIVNTASGCQINYHGTLGR